LKILVYEHVSGGGYSEEHIDLSVLSEGFGMLRCLTADLKAAGHELTALLDSRISKLNPPLAVDCIVPVFHAGETAKFLLKATEINDAAYIIAPETDETLESTVRLLEETGKVSLNSKADTIHQVADKTVLSETLKDKGLRVPKTIIFDANPKADEVNNAIKSHLTYPVILKPSDGVSCGGLTIVERETQTERAMAKLKAGSRGKRFIAQEFVRGEAASVSLLCAGTQSLALSLNKQNVQLASVDRKSSYVGGVVPLDHPMKQEAFDTAEKIAGIFHGLRGYVGVDLILSENGPCVVDVNPRLTTSYIGLSRVAGFNVANAMVNAVLKGRLPAKREGVGCFWFSKVETPKPTLHAFAKSKRIKGLISPPFLFKRSPRAVSLVAGYGETSTEAERRFEEAKKRLLNIISEGD